VPGHGESKNAGSNLLALIPSSVPQTSPPRTKTMASTAIDSSAPLSDLQQRIQDRKRTQLELFNRKLEREKRAKSVRAATPTLSNVVLH
jgi:hypothetical protein